MQSCGFRARVNEYYDLVDAGNNAYPFDIDGWYKWQRRCVARQVKDNGFELSLSGSLCTLRVDRLRKPPQGRKVLSLGKAKLTKHGLLFEGTLDGETADFDFPARSVYSLTFSTKGFLEFCHNNDYFITIPDGEEKGLVKWTLASEEIHNFYDDSWRSACADVYEYDKGDIYG